MYTALKERLLAYGGNAKKAFETPFYKPQKSNQALIEVKKVKIQQRENLLVEVNQGKSVAANESMIRIDIFTKDNKYYIVPIYMKDVVAKKLPNKAIVANKRYEEWIEMDESYEFKFTLYPNDLIYFKHKKGAKFKANNKESLDLKEGFAYYVKTHSGNGGITIRTHDNKYLAENMGVKTLITLEKYVVDVLGNKTKINKETRLDYTNKKR